MTSVYAIIHQNLNLDLCQCFVWLDASITFKYYILTEYYINFESNSIYMYGFVI